MVSISLQIVLLFVIIETMDAQMRAKVEEIAQKVRWAADRL